ncbi:hypothetical protein ACWGQ5_27975 [Streptomyces sp. NPDC055722]
MTSRVAPSLHRRLPYMFVAKCPDDGEAIDITVCVTTLELLTLPKGSAATPTMGLYAEAVLAQDGGATHQRLGRYSRLDGETRWCHEVLAPTWLFEPGERQTHPKERFSASRSHALIAPIAAQLDYMAWRLGLTSALGGAPAIAPASTCLNPSPGSREGPPQARPRVTCRRTGFRPARRTVTA